MKKLLILILILCNMMASQGREAEGLNKETRQETDRLTMRTEEVDNAWLEENLEHITLELYYIDPCTLTRNPVTINNIKQSCDMHITADTETVMQQRNLLIQMLNTPITTLDEKDSHLNARIYYALCDDTGKVVFDVAMWGMDGELFINGIPCEEEFVFYDVAIEFLPPDIALAFESYLEGDGAFEIPRRQGDG